MYPTTNPLIGQVVCLLECLNISPFNPFMLTHDSLLLLWENSPSILPGNFLLFDRQMFSKIGMVFASKNLQVCYQAPQIPCNKFFLPKIKTFGGSEIDPPYKSNRVDISPPKMDISKGFQKPQLVSSFSPNIFSQYQFTMMGRSTLFFPLL